MQICLAWIRFFLCSSSNTFHTQTGSSSSLALETFHLSVSSLGFSSPYHFFPAQQGELQAILLEDRIIDIFYCLGLTFNHGVLLLTLGTKALSLSLIEANEIAIQ